MIEPDPKLSNLLSNEENLLDCLNEQQDATSNIPQASTSFFEDSMAMPALMTKSLSLELHPNSSKSQVIPQTVTEQSETSSAIFQEHGLSHSCIINQRLATGVPTLSQITELEEDGLHVQMEKRVNEIIMSQINSNINSVGQQANQNNRQIQPNELASNGLESEISSSLRVQVSPGRQEESKSEFAASSDLLNLPSQNVQLQQNCGNELQGERQIEQIEAPIQQYIQMPPIEFAFNAVQQANIVMVPDEGLFNRDVVIMEDEPTAADFADQNVIIEAINDGDRNASNQSIQINDIRQTEFNEMLSQQLHEVIAKDQCVEMQIEPIYNQNRSSPQMQHLPVNIPMDIQQLKPNQQEIQEEKQQIQQILTEMDHEQSNPVSHAFNPMKSHVEDRIFTFGKPITKPEPITPYFNMEGNLGPQAQSEESCPWTMSAVIDEQEREPAPANYEIPPEIQVGNANNGSMNVEHDNNFREHPAISQIHEEIISTMVYLADPVEAQIKIQVQQNALEQQMNLTTFTQYEQNSQPSFTQFQQFQQQNEEIKSNQLTNIYRTAYGLVSSPSYPIKRQGNVDYEFELERQPPPNNYQNQSEQSEDSDERKLFGFAKKVQQTLQYPNDSNHNHVSYFFGQPQINSQPSQYQTHPQPQLSAENQTQIALMNMDFEEEQPIINVKVVPLISKLQVKKNGSNQKEKIEDHSNSAQIVDVRYNPNGRVQEQRVLQQETSIQYRMASREIQQDPPADISEDHLAIHNSPIDLISHPQVSQVNSVPNIQNNSQDNRNNASNVQQSQPAPQPQPAINAPSQVWGLPGYPSYIPAYIPLNSNPCQYINPHLFMQPQQQFIPQFSNPVSSYYPSYNSGFLPTISININRMNEISLNMFSNGNQQFMQPQPSTNFLQSENQRFEVPHAPPPVLQPVPQPVPPPVVQRQHQRQNEPRERVEPPKEVIVKKDASTQACLPLPQIESSSDRDRSNQKERERDNRFKTKIEPINNNEFQDEIDNKQCVEFKIGLCADKYLLNQHPSDQDHRDFQQELQPYINLKFTPEPRNECGEHLFRNGLIMLAMVKLIVRTSPTPFILNHIYEYISSTYQINKNRFGFIQEAAKAKEVYQDYLDKQYLERYAKKRDEISHQEEVIKRKMLNIAPQVAISELLKSIQPLPAVPRAKPMTIDSNSFSINERVCAVRQQPVREVSVEKISNYVQYDIKLPIVQKLEVEQRKPLGYKYQPSKPDEAVLISPTVKDKNHPIEKGVTTNTQKDDILIKLSEKLLKTDDHKQKEKQVKNHEKGSSNIALVAASSDKKDAHKKNQEGEGDNNKYLDLFQKYKKIRQIKKIDPKGGKPIDVEEKKNHTQGDSRSEIKPEELTDKRNRRVQFLEEPASREKDDDQITNEEDDEENGRKKKKGKSKGKPKRDTSAEDSEQDEPIPRDNRRKKSQTKK